jgi:alanine-glyoxylate transaminase / serine-glyoxylate transaminase / serine-pyruvate transaminase
MTYQSGRHFLQIPGPTNVPDRILTAMAAPTIDHRGPEFADLARHVLAGVARLCGTAGPVALYPSSGTGAWEAALVNTLSPGDRVLAFETGQFATLWAQMAAKFGLDVDLVPGDWRRGVQASQVGEKLAADRGHQIKAVTIVQNETSTGCASQIPPIRAAMGRRPASGFADRRHDLIAGVGRVPPRRVGRRPRDRVPRPFVPLTGVGSMSSSPPSCSTTWRSRG